MAESTFYTDHWRQIEDERVERYERMFAWRDGHAMLLAPLGSWCGVARLGLRLVDPASWRSAWPEWLARPGAFTAWTLNARFVADATRRGEAVSNVSYHQLEDGRIPLADATVDRLLCKNVLEYVPDVQATLAEFRRVLEPGGRLLLIDSDWAFVVAEPWGAKRTARFFCCRGSRVQGAGDRSQAAWPPA